MTPEDNDSADVTPTLEQLAQQEADGEPVVVVALATTVISTVQGHRAVLTVVDDKGAIWERSNEMQPGLWNEIERPKR